MIISTKHMKTKKVIIFIANFENDKFEVIK